MQKCIFLIAWLHFLFWGAMYHEFNEEKCQANLTRFRKLRGYTQKQVEEKLSLRALTIYDYESGRLKLPVDLAVKLANLYQCSMGELLGVQAKSSNKNETDQIIAQIQSEQGQLEELGVIKNRNFHLAQLILNDPIILADIGKMKIDIPRPAFNLITESLSAIQKKNFLIEFLKYLNSMIGIDGRLAPEELMLREALISHVTIPLNESEKNSIRKAITKPYFGSFFKKGVSKKSLKHFIVWTLFYMGLSDGELGHKEEQYLAKVAKHIGVARENFLEIKIQMTQKTEE